MTLQATNPVWYFQYVCQKIIRGIEVSVVGDAVIYVFLSRIHLLLFAAVACLAGIHLPPRLKSGGRTLVA